MLFSRLRLQNRLCVICPIIFFLVSTNGWAFDNNVIDFPRDHCHALRREVKNSFNEVADPLYDGLATQERWDIICIGDIVRVERPVRSNGGDIIIFANRLELLAPIDSRPYFSPDDYEQFRARSKINDGEYYAQPDIARPGSPLFEVYKDYYRRSPDSVKVNSLSKIFLPELPAGITGNIYAGCEDPSPYIRQNLPASVSPPALSAANMVIKPGNIYILANTFSFHDDTLRNYPLYDGDPLICKVEERYTTGKAFIARGLRGGRGGAGATLAADNAICGKSSRERNGLLNATGGSGGPGGTISISIVGIGNTDLSQELRGRSSVVGGPPGSTQKLRAPAYEGPGAPKLSSVCDFHNEGEWPNKPSSGSDGGIEIIERMPTDAMLELSRLLGSRDARLDYDFKELQSRAMIAGERVKAFTFSGFAERKFFEHLISIQIAWLERLNTLVATGKEREKRILSGVWDELDITKINQSVFSNDAAQPLRMLAMFQQARGYGPVKSYFYNTGGLLNLRSAATINQWNALANRTDNANTNTKLDRMRASVAALSEGVADIREVVKSNHYRNAIAELEAKVKLLEIAIKQDKDAKSDTRKLQAIKTIADGVAALLAAYYGDVPSAGVGVVKLQQGLQQLSYAMQLPEGSLNLEVEGIKSKILLLERQYDSFLRYMSDEKIRILTERSQILLDFFESNSSYGARLQSRSVLFHDLIRIVLIGYLQDLSRNPVELRTNLVALHTLLKDYPTREPPLSFRDIELGCSAQEIGERRCMLIQPHAAWMSLDSNEQDWTDGLALYVFAPSKQPKRVSTFGLSGKITTSSGGRVPRVSGYFPLSIDWSVDTSLGR